MKPPLPISTINRNWLQTDVDYRVTLHLRADSSKKQRVVANLIRANIVGYDLVLSMAWHSRHNPNVMWRDYKQYWQSIVTKGNDPVLLKNLAEFYSSMRI